MKFPVHLFCLTALMPRPAVIAAEPAAAVVAPHPVPSMFTAGRYERYTVTVNGKPVPLFHAALNIYFASFDFTGSAEVRVVAKAADYWQGLAIVRPTSRGIVAKTDGEAVSFTLTAPGQFSVERPGISQLLVERPSSNRFDDEVLFVFANPPDRNIPRADDPKVVWLGPGLHQQNVDLTSGETLYLAPGAVLFGGINVWDAENVRICGRGAVVYYGPQSPDYDTGWVHVRNWHPLTTHAVHGLAVEGVTFIGRSRTWTIQMWMTTGATFNNIKIIGASAANVNNDGIDWYGGGQASVRDSLIRSADDCFAFLAPLDSSFAYRSDVPPWDLTVPEGGPARRGEVSDIEIERCVLWPTRANVMRVAVRATREFSTRHVLMRDCDLIHNQRHIWYAPESLFCCITTDGKGGSVHQDYLFDNIRFEEPMALLGVNAPEAQFENFRFKQLHFLAGIPTGMLHAGVDGMRFEDVRAVDRLAQSASDLNLAIDGKVKNIQFSPSTSEPQKAHRDDKGGATP